MLFIALDERVVGAQNRVVKALALFVFLLSLGMTAAPDLSGETTPPDVAKYGAYPTNYKEITYNWLKTQLVDVDSARIEWLGDPKPADLGKDGNNLYGWLLEFKINAKNRFGSYTGKQKHGVLIRNSEVIKGIGFGY